MTSTKTTVTVTGDGPLADAIRGREAELAAGIDHGERLEQSDRLEQTTDALGDDLRLFDGWVVKTVTLKITGGVKLYLADDVHRDLVTATRLRDLVKITAVIVGEQVELLGRVQSHGFAQHPQDDGLAETITVKITDALGSSGKPVVDDDGKDA